jgi:hypothetical protein
VSDEREKMETAVYTHNEKGQREDVHRPSVINPGDYDYIRVGVNRKHPITGGPAGVCHHCGKAIVWEVYYRHLPSGNVVTFGYICAGILSLTDNRIDHEMVLLKRKVENERREAREQMDRDERTERFKVQYGDLYDYLEDNQDSSNWFVKSLWQGLQRWGDLTPRQITALQTAIKRDQETAVRKLQEAKELENAPVLQAVRGRLEGVVISTKYQHSENFGDTPKMLVKSDSGNKVYGTIPNNLMNEVGMEDLKGKRVRFVATIKPKEDHFGIFSHPRNAEVI